MRLALERRPILALLIAAAVLVAAGTPAGAATKGRVVVIGDIHGADVELDEILRETGLIDDNQDWVGAGTRFVQTGDFTDRGSGMRPVMDLLMKLQKQAAKAGDEVRVLLGNHEMMNLILEDRDLRINPAIYESFADERSEERRERAWEEWVEWRKRRLKAQDRAGEEAEPPRPEVAAFLGQSREEWLQAHPPGLVEQREAFGADGVYGRWIRKLPIATRVDDTLLLHGGLSAEWLDRSLKEINRIHSDHVQAWTLDRKHLEKRSLVLPYFSWTETRLALEHHLLFPRNATERQVVAGAWLRQNELVSTVFAEASPLWFRGYALPPLGLADDDLADLLDLTADAYDVRRVAAGHTPVASRTVLERLGGRVYQIDTGMLRSHYKGRPAALVIEDGEVRAVVLGEAAEEQPTGSDGAATAAETYATEGGAVAAEPSLAAEIAPLAGEPAEVEPPAEVQAPAEPKTPAAEKRGHLFLGPDGAPLPIQDRDAIERFLKSARVVGQEEVGQGKSGALKLRLEQGGIRADAVFHDIDETIVKAGRTIRLSDGTRVQNFRDSFTGQIAAYELGKLLAIENIPPAVPRKLEGSRGSIALWIEEGTNLFGWREQGNKDPKGATFWHQMYDMRVFDAVIDNFDRNSQNIFWAGDFDLWLIDHTRSFTRNRRILRPDKVSRCSRGLYERLRALDEEEVRERLSPYLGSLEIKAVSIRRDRVLDLLDEEIRTRGEELVLFDYGSDSEDLDGDLD